ncbi:MAG: flagellar export chaperone FlgN [Arthrobacter sp.]
MDPQKLSALLWEERELLEFLTFKLDEQQLLLTTGRTRWIKFATTEIEQATARLRAAGLARDLAVSAVAEDWGLAEDAGLRQIIAGAPGGPWAEIFSSHLAAMTALTDEIEELREANEQLLRDAVRSTQESIAGRGSRPSSNNASGSAGDPAENPPAADRKM